MVTLTGNLLIIVNLITVHACQDLIPTHCIVHETIKDIEIV